MDSLKMKLVLSEDSSAEKYGELYDLNVGDVFKIRGNYETVMQRIEDYKPQNLTFGVFPINPGTSLYTMYGPDHCVVIEKAVVNG